MIKLHKTKRMGERGPGKRARFLPIGMIAGPASGFITMFLKNWKIGLFAILIAIIVYQNTVSFEFLKPVGLRTIPGMEQDIVKIQEQADRQVRIMAEQLAECEISRETLKDEIAASNAEVEKWVALSQSLQQSQNDLTQTLIDLKKTSTAELEIILQGPIPQTCKGAIKLLREAVTSGDLKWK